MERGVQRKRAFDAAVSEVDVSDAGVQEGGNRVDDAEGAGYVEVLGGEGEASGKVGSEVLDGEVEEGEGVVVGYFDRGMGEKAMRYGVLGFVFAEVDLIEGRGEEMS